jgi:hypothetical protein
MLIDKIFKYYYEQEKSREWSNGLRMSNAGKCARALAYQYHGFKAEPLSGRARMVFRLGDLVEQDLVDAALKVSNFKGMQQECSFELDGQIINGHVDGYITEDDGNSVGVDFKSISDFGFKNAQKGEVDYSYVCQAHCYMKAMGWNKFLVVFYKKHTSHLCEVVIDWNEKVWMQIKNRFRSVFKSTKENMPDREYQPNDKGKLPWQCSYCAYSNHCWPEAELTFDKDNKPILLIKENKK